MMSEPSAAAYEVAAEAESLRKYGEEAGIFFAAVLERIKPSVDAVWPLAVAEGRRQAAADPCPCQTLRDQPHPSRDNGPDCSYCGRPAMAAVHDPRLGLARGAEIKAEIARRSVTFVHSCGYSQVSPIPHLCPQCGTAEPWS